MRLRFTLIAALLALTWSASTPGAEAAPPFFAASFHLHDFDDEIIAAVGSPDASMLYFREMGSITEDQMRVRRQYEPIGCHPFYLMLAGKVHELGYNCRSFFCVGYSKGPRVCQDSRRKAYGGVTEISRRLGLVTIQDIRKFYTEYAEVDRTQTMKDRITALSAVACRPFYLQEFDVVVGDGFACDAIGKYPNYSGDFDCVTDLRVGTETVCSLQLRDTEMDIRTRIVAASGGGSSSGAASSSVASASASSASSAPARVTFTDVEEGKYGYTAITTLAAHGIIKGYGDGTFRPKNIINRAEFLQLLVRGLYPERLQLGLGCFPDVGREWFAEVVCTAKHLGWVSGYADKRFHPERTMRRSEAIKVIVGSLGQPLDSAAALPQGVVDNAWYTPYIRKAVELGIILEPSFQAEGEVTRADAAVWMYRSAKLLKRF